MRFNFVRASAVLVALGLPSVAAASGYMNSGYMNSGYMNSGYMNSGYMNSGYMNSGYMNSGYMNGGSIGGFNLGPMMTSQGKPIDNVVLVKDYLTGSAQVWEFDHWSGGYPIGAWHYRALAPDEFLNATFDGTINDNSTDQLAGYVTSKITEVRTIAGADGTTHYQYVVQWKDAQTNALNPLCGCENDNPYTCFPVPATLVQGMWNYTQGTIDGGKKISNDPNLFTVACGGGAISKCSSDQATQAPQTPSSSYGISASYGTWAQRGAWNVYPGEQVTVKLTNVNGDQDLYVRWNNTPTGSAYSCHSINGGNTSETCTLTVPSWAYYMYIGDYGYQSGSATLSVTATPVPRGMGYTPYRTQCFTLWGNTYCNTSPTYEQQSCTRMVTADYCGDGTPHTVTGRPIDVYDHFSPTLNSADPNTDAYYFESEWTPNGANSIGTCRVDNFHLSDADPMSCPWYGNYHHSVAHYVMVNNGTACAANQQYSGVYTDRDGYLYNTNTGTYYPPQPRIVALRPYF